jgi:hypothetical protein
VTSEANRQPVDGAGRGGGQQPEGWKIRDQGQRNASALRLYEMER